MLALIPFAPGIPRSSGVAAIWLEPNLSMASLLLLDAKCPLRSALLLQLVRQHDEPKLAADLQKKPLLLNRLAWLVLA